MLAEYEISEEKEVKNIQVLSPYGWVNVKKIYKTIPLTVWELTTDTGKTVRGSAEHLLYGSNGWKHLKLFRSGEYVMTIDGWAHVKLVYNTHEVDSLYDLETDATDGAFYSDGLVSHNSTTFCARQLILTHLLNNYKSLYVVPHHKQLETYGARFSQMEMSFRCKDGAQNVYNKSYKNRSAITMIHCGETSQAARGKSATECVIDECVHAHTTVSMSNSGENPEEKIKICEVPIGAKITGFNEYNEQAIVEITAKQCNGTRRCYRVRTKSGRELICTGNHRLRTDSGWRYTIELAGGLCGLYEIGTSSNEGSYAGEENRMHGRTCTDYDRYEMFLCQSGDADNSPGTKGDSEFYDWESCMFLQGMSDAARKLQKTAPKILIETESGAEWDTLESIEYVGMHEVWDITTTPHHTFFADGIGVHNCQSMNPDHIEDILYTLTDSRMPTTIFAGTALSIDTLLEAKWAESSMGMWHVRAGDGKHWLNMYDKDILYKVCNSPQGPTCPYTGKLLDVTNGCFIHAYPGKLADGRIGMHIPQCIIPDLAYNPIKWGAIYNKVKYTDFKKVLQECFGIAIAEGSREITTQDLQRMCVLPDTPEQLKAKCRSGYYRVVISGCDWGGSDYNPNTKSKTSYTVHCIIGLAPDNTVDILHYKRYSGMMYPDIAASIVRDHEDYYGTVLASDFGVGLAYNMEIRKHIPIDKHYVIGYVGPQAEDIAVPKNAHLDNQLSVNRTEAITNVFRDAKSLTPQKIRCREWSEMQDYLNDWLNMFRVPSENNTGQKTFRYIRAATKADDALHAFTFAYVMMKIFKGESLIQDPQLEAKIRQTMAAPSIQHSQDMLRQEMFGEDIYCISG